jgi:hypothetical protein
MVNHASVLSFRFWVSQNSTGGGSLDSMAVQGFGF